jgi:predicted amidophosphoribosyltransferase
LPRNAFRVPSLLAQDAPPTWASGDYTGVVQRLVLAYKDDPPRGRPDLQRVLASCLAQAALGALSGSGAPDDVQLLLVPVPSTGATVRRRGADLTAGLAQAAASRLRRSGRDVVVLPAVRRRRVAGHQAGLSAAQRSRNLDGALVLRRGPALVGPVVLVVDDVVTTGASLQACSQVLIEAGAHVLGAATVAATPLRHERHADREADVRGGLSAPPGKD